MATQPPATTIGKYKILGLVGEGAMGAVYRALDPVLQRPVAIKVMSDSVAREQELRERFLREAQAAGSLQHPNVVTIYDFGEVDGHLFIAMEFLDGEDLEALLAKRADLSLSAKLGIAVDVLGGLSYAHKRGIVHRDIKPANIRITEDERAKIMDFGVAHLTSQKMTRTGMTMGTPNYMAPEQVAGGAIGAHTDVFSLGAVLYELLTHHKPFAAETLHAVLYKIVSEPTPLASTHAPGLPPELDAIVARSLAKDPAERYQTAAEMANDLTALRASLGTLSGARQASSISLNARLATAVPGLAAPTMPTPGVPTAAAPAARAGVGRGAIAFTGALAVLGLGVGAWAFTRSGAAPATDAAAPASLVASAPAATPQATSEATPSTTAPASARTAAAPTPGAPAPSAPAARPRETAPAPTVSASIPAAPRPVATATPAAVGTSAPPPVPRAPESASTPTPSREAPPATAPAAEPSANAAAEIAETVARYARAISGRDLGAVRAAYPNITSAQEKNFERFFASVRELRASFTLSNLDVSGTTADARLNGVYEFVTSAGQRERSPVNFQASFRRDGGSWVLSAVR